ncbi:MAG TPA: hypothetical protein VLZ07_01305 [Syntrophales bacterium]|nr:hypothetical protein [Syntrophales bacterium]
MKIFVSYLILVLLAIAVMDFFLTPKIDVTTTQLIEDDMFGIARILTAVPGETISGKVPEVVKQLNIRVTLIDQAGRVISDSQADAKQMENHFDRPEIQQARAEGRGKASRYSVTLQENMLYLAVPIKEDGKIKGYVRLARPLVEVRKSINQLHTALYLTLFIIAVPSLLLAVLFSRSIASRLTAFSKE